MPILSERIKQRRRELGLSQAELAKLLGYSDRSTIAKIEKGVNDITQSKIEAFAEALHTTAAYLTGWTSSPYDYEIDKEPAPAWLEQERSKWRRFELITADPNQIYALNSILEKAELTRYELAVIVASLRVRPGFSLEDFCT